MNSNWQNLLVAWISIICNTNHVRRLWSTFQRISLTVTLADGKFSERHVVLTPIEHPMSRMSLIFPEYCWWCCSIALTQFPRIIWFASSNEEAYGIARLVNRHGHVCSLCFCCGLPFDMQLESKIVSFQLQYFQLNYTYDLSSFTKFSFLRSIFSVKWSSVD